MPLTVAARKPKIVLYGLVEYRCQAEGCDVKTLPENTYWWNTDTFDVLAPPKQPPAPPNPYIPFCSAEHLPRKE